MSEDNSLFHYRFDNPHFQHAGKKWLPIIAMGDKAAELDRCNALLLNPYCEKSGGKPPHSKKAVVWDIPCTAAEADLYCEKLRHLYHEKVCLEPHTIAVNIYSGTLDGLASLFPTEEMPAVGLSSILWRYHTALQSLENLAARASQVLDHEVTATALVDASSVKDYLDLLSLSNAARYEYVQIFWRCSDSSFYVPRCWQQGSAAYGIAGDDLSNMREIGDSALALLLPSCDYLSYPSEFGDALGMLSHSGLPYRCIAQERLSVEWCGLQQLIYHPALLNREGERLLQGFAATGGELIALADCQSMIRAVI